MDINKRPRKDLFPGNRVRIIKHSDSSFISKEAIVTGQDKKYVYITFDMGYYIDKSTFAEDYVHKRHLPPKKVMRIAPDCIEEI